MSEIVTPRDLDPITTLSGNGEIEVHEDGALVNNKMTKDSVKEDFGIDANTAANALNTAYKDRVKKKVIWTGPLAVVGVPTSLDGGEKFSDWDEIIVYYSFSGATSTSGLVMVVVSPLLPTSFYRQYDDTGYMSFQKLSDTTFQLSAKTSSTGNITYIIGKSL